MNKISWNAFRKYIYAGCCRRLAIGFAPAYAVPAVLNQAAIVVLHSNNGHVILDVVQHIESNCIIF